MVVSCVFITFLHTAARVFWKMSIMPLAKVKTKLHSRPPPNTPLPATPALHSYWPWTSHLVTWSVLPVSPPHKHTCTNGSANTASHFGSQLRCLNLRIAFWPSFPPTPQPSSWFRPFFFNTHLSSWSHKLIISVISWLLCHPLKWWMPWGWWLCLFFTLVILSPVLYTMPDMQHIWSRRKWMDSLGLEPKPGQKELAIKDITET